MGGKKRKKSSSSSSSKSSSNKKKFINALGKLNADKQHDVSIQAKKKQQPQSSTVILKGTNNFRQRLICSLLSGKPVKIEEIRNRDERPGLRPFEANLLRLLDKMTNGTKIEINVTGTTLFFRPGFITGGKIRHDCGTERGIGYYLEALIPLALFAKSPVKATLLGITNDNHDLSVDLIRTALLPGLQKTFNLPTSLQLKIQARGAPPKGGGEVLFTSPIVKQIKPILLVDEGKIKRMRGLAYSTRVSPQTANRMVDSARGLLNHWIPDVYIYTDHYKGEESGKSPGFGLCLVSESTTGVIYSAEEMAMGNQAVLPEALGRKSAELLCEEISNGGCVDTSCQSIYFLLMAISEESVSKIRAGKLSTYSIQFLRHLKDFFAVTFKVKADTDSNTILLSCLGAGLKNFSKKST
jgi:RNA 3'-terminal phosphate cyclase-like protein